MKYTFLLLFLLLSTYCFCQDQDTDGDGIPDKVEISLNKRYANQMPYSTYYNYMVSDFPEISIRFSDLKIGIKYSLSSSTSETATLTHTEDNNNSSTVSKKTYNSESVSNTLTATVKQGFGLGTSLFPSVSIEDQYKTTSENGFNYSKDDIDQYKQDYNKIQTQIATKQVQFSSQDGYATSTMYFYNPDPVRTIRISNVRIHILQFDMSSGAVSEQSIIPDLTVNLTASIVGQNQQGLDPTKNFLDLPSQTSVPVNFFIDKLNSYDIDNLIQSNQSLIFEVSSFDLQISDTKLSQTPIVYSAHSDDIRSNCFKMRIISPDADRICDIAKTDSTNTSITIHKALQILYPDPKYIQFGSMSTNGKNITYLKKLGSVESNLDLTIKPEDYTNENKMQGFWFVLTNYGREIYKDLDDPIQSNLNSHLLVTMIYVKGIDLINLSNVIATSNILEVGNGQNEINTGVTVSSDNLIEIKVCSQRAVFTSNINPAYITIPRWVNRVGTSNVNIGPVNQYTINENWQSCDDITDLNKLHFSFYIDQIHRDFTLTDCKIIEKSYLKDTLVLILKLKTDETFANAPLTIRNYYGNFNYGQMQLQEGYDHNAITTTIQNTVKAVPNAGGIGYDESKATINGQNVSDILKQNSFTIKDIHRKDLITILTLKAR
jgi:hypothetical protein